MNDCPPLPPSGQAKGVQLDRPMTAEEVHEVDDPTGGVRLCFVPKKFAKKCYSSHHIESCDTCINH